VDIAVEKVTEPKELRGTVMVVINEVATIHPVDKKTTGRRRAQEPSRVTDLESELQHAKEEVQTTREEMQTSQEELKSTNEELQSTNEELQSTNEELTTSKEEMQSLNEELQTLNSELQGKVDELSRSNNDMKNLLNSTDIATLFLDDELRVRRFTNQTAKIIKLIPGDAGRPITDIASDLEYEALADDAREVLRTLVFKEKDVAAKDGRHFTLRIMPYRTLENVIDGVVITFTDTSGAKALQGALKEQADQLRQLTESLPNLVWGARPDGAWDYLSRQWVDYTGIPEAEQLGYRWLEQLHADDRERVREQWRSSVRDGEGFHSEFRVRAASSAYRWFKSRAVPIRDSRGSTLKWYGTNTDVDDLKRAESERGVSEDRLGAVLDAQHLGLVALDTDLVVRSLNSAAERSLGRERGAMVGKNVLAALPELREAAEFERSIRRAMNEGAPVSFRVRLDGAGASEMTAVPERSPRGVLILFLGRTTAPDGDPKS
jgi:two-component system CheB/CheR fusion protein